MLCASNGISALFRRAGRLSAVAAFLALAHSRAALHSGQNPQVIYQEVPRGRSESDSARADILLARARDHFMLGETDQALQALDSLDFVFPAHMAPERFLLRSRCLLASGDTLGFEESYAGALAAAGKNGDFRALHQDVETLSTPLETNLWNNLATPAEKSVFFRKFWKSRDPDPISSHNEKLVEYYVYLSSQGQKSRSLSSAGKEAGEASGYGILALPEDTPIQELDLISFPWGIDSILKETHGRLPEPREPTVQPEAESDTLPVFTQKYYAADFLGRGGRIELEFYQSMPVKNTPGSVKPRSAVALFDSTWLELSRDSSLATKVFDGRDSVWIAVNRLIADPGMYYHALRLEVPGHRAVMRKTLEVAGYRRDSLELSGFVFGSPPRPGQRVYQRRGENILPRPSLVFSPGELVSVYYEVYNLKQDSLGERGFSESIKVTRVIETEEQKKTFSGDIEQLMRWINSGSNSLILTFDRQAPENSGPAVPEHFEMDTSQLEPGHYRLLLEVRDANSPYSREVIWYFNLREP